MLAITKVQIGITAVLHTWGQTQYNKGRTPFHAKSTVAGVVSKLRGLGAGKVAVLSLTAFGVNETDVLAAYVVEP